VKTFVHFELFIKHKNYIPMKKHVNALIGAALLIIFSTSCDLLNLVDINFTTDESSVDFTIEPASAGSHYDEIEIVTTEIKQEIEDNGGKLDNLKSIKVSDLLIEIVSGASNLDAFESFEILFESDGTAEKKIAWVDDVPLGVTQVIPDFIDENLKDYLGQDTYTITLSGVLRSETTTDIVLKVKAHYDVTL